MIDSFVFVLQNLQKYDFIVDFVKFTNTGKAIFSQKETGYQSKFLQSDLNLDSQYLNRYMDFDINLDEGFSRGLKKIEEPLERIELPGSSMPNDRLGILDTNELTESKNWTKLYFPSSHYGIKVFFDFKANKGYFDFSIPKFLFGTNVYQFVSHQADNDFSFYSSSSIDYNIDNTHVKLIDFIIQFFEVNFNRSGAGRLIDVNDVLVRRLDLCFNLLFRDVESKVQFMNLAALIARKHSQRDMKDYKQSGAVTGYHYATREYAFKIYDKGVEFLKNDYGELRKHNKKGGNFNLDKALNLAQKTVRFELGMRPAFINRVYKTEFLPKINNEYNRYYHIYKAFMSEVGKGKMLPGDFYKREFSYLDNLFDRKVFRKEVSNFQRFCKYIDRVSPVFLYESHISHSLSFCPVFVYLDSSFLKFLLQRFINHDVLPFSIKEKPKEFDFLVNLKREYNNNKILKRENFNYHTAITLVELLKIHQSFKVIKELKLLKDTAFYKYQKLFSSLGWEKNSVASLDFSVPFDFSQYHIECMFQGFIN